ncbi:MAG: molybdopterin-dependent oxidoreductase [Acidimicrobiia bacterium]|nr:molybdopterin-dependent oxidoreductase [Acidimicrobiia bacterium]
MRKPNSPATTRTTVTHWGAFEVDSDGSSITGVRPFAEDPNPSPIGKSLEAVTRSRVHRPAIRKSWLEGGPGTRGDLRGIEPFVEVSWDAALDLAASELDRVRSTHGNNAIFGGSYGWSSAGRFHHAQSQLHRFLTVIGGYTDKRDTYSHAAGEVITPHVVGYDYWGLQQAHTSVSVIAKHTDLVVSFGGIPLKNAQVQNGGMGRHTLRGHLQAARARGTRFVNISPIRDDVAPELDAEWLAPRPGSDVAVMAAMIHTLAAEALADEAFLETHCTGWPALRSYILGDTDGIPKTADWAGELSGLEPDRIRSLARELAGCRSMLNISWSLQRSDHGEQTWWMLIALACAVGQVGLPGGGFGIGYGAVASVGNGAPRRAFPSFGRPANPVDDFIPVSRIADMLLNPGSTFTYDGETRTYPFIDLVYWSGGNPFHHHQDLNRLTVAWQRPSTIIVNEPFWTSTAKRADIVFPATTPLERRDVGGSSREDFLFALEPAIVPVGESRDDYRIFSDLAARLGVEDEFTEGRTSDDWVRHLYEVFESRYPDAPTYDEFVEAGYFQYPETPDAVKILLDAFRADPEADPLPTPSGKIELYSETIAGFGHADCPPHPTFLEPREWLGVAGEYPLHLLSSQPSTRLHSQLDHGATSAARKIDGREVLRMHPDDAAARGIADGDTVRVFNDRGACFAGIEVTDGIRSGVVDLPTGAWYDPMDPSVPGSPCRHGNPNVLTRDEGTSSLAQGPVAQSCLVEVEKATRAPRPDPHSSPHMTSR